MRHGGAARLVRGVGMALELPPILGADLVGTGPAALGGFLRTTPPTLILSRESPGEPDNLIGIAAGLEHQLERDACCNRPSLHRSGRLWLILCCSHN